MRLAQMLFEPVTEVIHGVVVTDPYRWLEDRSLPETNQWIQDQQLRCEEYFAGCDKLDVLRGNVREYIDVEVNDQPTRVSGRYFYRRRDRGQEQASIYVRNIATGDERLLIDPSASGLFTSVGIHRICDDGSLLAYELRDGGEDRKAIQIVEVESGRILPDKVETGYARGFAFASDKGGFYYCHEVSAASEDHTIRLHRFQKPKTDQAIFRVARSRGSRLVLISDRFYLGAIWVHHYGEDLVADFQIASKNTPENWKRVFVNRKLPYSPFLNNGHVFVLSYRDAPRGKLVELTHDGSELRIVVPEQDAIIRQFVISGESIFISCFQNMAFQFGSEFVWKRFGTNRYSYRWNDPVAPQSKSRRSQRFLHS